MEDTKEIKVWKCYNITIKSQANTLEDIKKKIIPVLKHHKAKKAGLFGSLVRGQMKKRSDIDILVDLPRNLSLVDVVGIQQEIEKVVGRKVDLVEYAAIKPLLKKYILSEEIRIL